MHKGNVPPWVSPNLAPELGHHAISEPLSPATIHEYHQLTILLASDAHVCTAQFLSGRLWDAGRAV